MESLNDQVLEYKNQLGKKPDFDDPEELKKQIEEKTVEFVNDIIPLLNVEGT